MSKRATRSAAGLIVAVVLVGCARHAVTVVPRADGYCEPDTLVPVQLPVLPPVPDSLLGTNGAIVGGVFDVYGRPIAHARVIIDRGDSTRTRVAAVGTDDAGLFVAGGLRPGTYAVSAHRLGYRAALASVTVQPNAVDTLTVRLHCSAVRLVALPVLKND